MRPTGIGSGSGVPQVFAGALGLALGSALDEGLPS
jgi:hypothetical protein